MIAVLDFGGQYTHLIAQKVRKMGAYAEIFSPQTSAAQLKSAHGIILSGGPQSVYEAGSPTGDLSLFELGIPILGICYGWQWMAQVLGGQVLQQERREYGPVMVHQVTYVPFLWGCAESFTVWMSHGDSVTNLPSGFTPLAVSPDCPYAAAGNLEKKLYGLQFHPEVTHTEHGLHILRQFIKMCNPPSWSTKNLVLDLEDQIRTRATGKKVFMLVSGGVDSVVAFTLLNRILGAERVQGVLIDTGLMRLGEISAVQKSLAELGIGNLQVEDAHTLFIDGLANVIDPEEKRLIIGEAFVTVYERISQRLGLLKDEWLLGQGTIYPDRIESGVTSHADRIKTHHNRVDGIQKLIQAKRVIEPLHDFYKDEVREVGELMGLPHQAVWRHPFPGPGLGIRILCSTQAGPVKCPSPDGHIYYELPVRSVGVQGDKRSYAQAVTFFSDGTGDIASYLWKQATLIPNTNPRVNRVLCCLSHICLPRMYATPLTITEQSLGILRQADAQVEKVLREHFLYHSVWQFPVVLAPFGCRPGTYSIILRPVNSENAMTAAASHLPPEALKEMTKLILGLTEISMVFCDLTSKPPGTIEWE